MRLWVHFMNEEVSYSKCTNFLSPHCFALYMALVMTLQMLSLSENWKPREACVFLADPSETVSRDGCFDCTDALQKLNCANVPFLCSSLHRCPILMLLRSWNSQLILLIHIPNHLIELVVQFNPKHKVNWTTIKIKWSFQFYVEDYIFCKSTQNWNQPDEFFI